MQIGQRCFPETCSQSSRNRMKGVWRQRGASQVFAVCLLVVWDETQTGYITRRLINQFDEESLFGLMGSEVTWLRCDPAMR